MKRRPPRAPRPFNFGRRRFLAGMAAAGALGLPGCSDQGTVSGSTDPLPVLPNPEDSGIDHIVQVMMENRSFDHMLGWVPGADGVQAGLTYKNIEGADVQTFRLSEDPAYGYQGCDWADPSHGYETGRTHYNGGAMDGFLLTGGTKDNPADKFPVGYYTADDLGFYRGAAQHFTVCDRYFHGILNSTFPNRIYMHAGATDRMSNTLPVIDSGQGFSTLETIWDRLIARGISCRNYFGDLPLTGLWGPKYLDITAPFEQFLVEAAAGQLPAVSYFDPIFGFSVGEEPGLARDDHPHSDVRDGQAYLNLIYDALRTSPNWERTLMIVTYDEWGGFFDHVPPPAKAVSAEEAALGNDGLLGFRTPCVVIGPRARRGHVSHIQFDPQSVIDLVTWRFGLDPLGARAGSAITNNFALALDFASPPNPDAPAFDVPMGPGGTPYGLPFATPCDSPVSITELLESLPLPGASTGSLSATDARRLEHLRELLPLYQMAKASGYL